MTRSLALLCAILCFALPVHAQEGGEPALTSYDLYSWPGRFRGHRFALLPSAARAHAHADVTRAGQSVKPLTGVLLELPRGTKITWRTRKELVDRWGSGGTVFGLPAPKALAMVRATCRARGLVLSGAQRRVSVIYFIGDGMGVSQLTLGRLGAQAAGQPYNFDRFKSLGLASTRSATHLVTDSAAGATALATGHKTYNKSIGMSVDKRPMETVLERAHAEGYVTGLVTTTRITHATPAAFIAKVDHRRKEKEIASQMAARGFPEVLIGGGRRNFTSAHLEQFKNNGFTLVTETSKLAAAKGGKLLALLAGSHLPFAIDKGSILPAITKKAVEVLSAQGPFFLMVEGGRVDHAGHQHDAASCLHDQLDLDKAVGWALDLAHKDPSLLVVVTADHATGSLGISEKAKIKAMLGAKASTTQIVRETRPKPGETAALLKRIKASHGFDLTAEEQSLITRYPRDPYFAATALGHLLSRRYGIEFYELLYQQENLTHTYGHDGGAVGVFAFGPGCETFQGIYENTEIPKRIAKALGIGALSGTGTK
jgi:alkaline phosphatase